MLDLYTAAFKGDVDEIRRAVAIGVDPNAQHPRAGTLPLQIACQADSLDAIAALLECGANVNRVFSRTSRVDGRVITDHVPLMYAVSPKAAKLLLDAGADINATDDTGRTSLALAVERVDPVMVEFFISHGAEIRTFVDFARDRIRILKELWGEEMTPEQGSRFADAQRCLDLLTAASLPGTVE